MNLIFQIKKIQENKSFFSNLLYGKVKDQLLLENHHRLRLTNHDKQGVLCLP
jgi:hypothetical protein